MSIKKTIIEVRNLSFCYRNNVILDNISFTIEEGSYVGIIGPNGGGKTTLLKLLLGLLQVHKGSISIFGKPIGYVPQHAVQENIAFPATVFEVVESGKSDIKKEEVQKALEIVGISHLRDKLLKKLSGGERQRVFVARALVGQPKLLILDEPFTGVDVASQENFYDLLEKLNTEKKITILFVSHDIDVISSKVKEILCLNKRLVCQGSPQSVMEKSMIENLYGTKITHVHRDYV